MEYCLQCQTELCHLDDDPNGDSNPTCARCRAEEDHDFDLDPGAKFDRAGGYIEGRKTITRRETDVLNLVCIGLENKEIAARLHIATDTAKEHVHNLLAKTNSRNRTHLATWTTRQALAAIDIVGRAGGPGLPDGLKPVLAQLTAN